MEELRKACADQGCKSPYCVCQRSPQGGWYVTGAGDYASAERFAVDQSGAGAFEICVVPGDPRHGLLKLVGPALESENLTPEPGA
jgi:hypothetical protein